MTARALSSEKRMRVTGSGTQTLIGVGSGRAPALSPEEPPAPADRLVPSPGSRPFFCPRRLHLALAPLEGGARLEMNFPGLVPSLCAQACAACPLDVAVAARAGQTVPVAAGPTRGHRPALLLPSGPSSQGPHSAQMSPHARGLLPWSWCPRRGRLLTYGSACEPSASNPCQR